MPGVALDRVRPAGPRAAAAFDAVATVVVVVAIAAAARVTVPVPGSPVPVTLQSLVVLLVGAWMGAGRGAGAVLAYVVAGALGLPVFAGGTSGVARLLGPTGGYLVGFVIAAAAVGLLAERDWDRTLPRALATAVAGTACILLAGLVGLAAGGGGWTRALDVGVVPHLAGASAKAVVATVAMVVVRRIAG